MSRSRWPGMGGQNSALARRRQGLAAGLVSALLLASLALMAGCHVLARHATLDATGTVLEPELPRYGLNLGGSGTWGAEQLRANILSNPGFEAVLDRTLLIVKAAAGARLIDDSPWLAREPGFWSGGRYDVRSGAAVSRSGRIIDSNRRGDGLAEISIDAELAAVQAGDVIVLTRDSSPHAAAGWWRGQGQFASATDDRRPGSPGHQSLRLLATPAQPAELLHYFDNIGARAGKLLPVQGPWRLSFWARADNPRAQLHVHFDRGGHVVFIDADIELTATWRHHVIEFSGADHGPPGVLTLGIKASQGEVVLDDAYLGEADPPASGFRRGVVETLQGLRPGYLRDWQGQLGDTLVNRLADTHAHQPVRYRPGADEVQFHYGLRDFLQLCAEVGAQPWVVAPTTLDDGEWRQFGAWLRAAADQHGFDSVMVEFGNENWNAIFRPGGIPNAATHAAVADRAFRLLREGSGDDRRLITVANAQFVNPESPRQIGAATTLAQRIAVAPYFLYRLDAGTSATAARQAAFQEGSQLIDAEADTARRQGKRLAVYEENFHTTLGTADAATRNTVVTAAASGPALARRLLQGTLAGVREQAVYSFAGFDSYLQEGQGLVRLWGISRDLATPHRLRPTGIALAMLNRVAGGAAHRVSCRGAPCRELTAVAFAADRYAIVSARAQSTEVVVACTQDSIRLERLDGSDLKASNESLIEVTMQDETLPCREGRAVFMLPAYSLATLRPGA